ncbi:MULTISPECIES: NifU family protein [Clostridium]|uniref:Thioredoxin TrxA n=1 Tax=Clostridium saccharoperbutylacetonicum N1-4(HMT) TaxID=931276 RepID=M1MD25_9CLOT|nr:MULTISPECIES: NifU family protein [Clostridium]AGF54278.1 thioredoxin TrxA [Clostridium saccharoperbutylacetonicum N1-4(HMT)]AQR93195.1 Fe/S biogenesis protein NfuA [Clostridium saccharoperbutylacetonicum]NRT59206.1 Fe-S cluster biogenesis protein NfuA [Clostridium saccharoperbutylacetonicum]NSB28395.1 Fe-S cluster biogenesis protein NfuA [Clostridium saccharoperbutylacetonicum]NSB34612.1 Fe-S cluster biogenesis protein NfuA [Clostridium saccharoperbutylacetonicum]
MKELIVKSLDKIRPILQRDGGDVELVDVSEDGIVSVKMQGACGNCPGAMMTIKMIIEEKLKEEVPGIKKVIGV